ncbi:bone morphogenetic protein receptor type-2-like [Aulostomus maculatus]
MVLPRWHLTLAAGCIFLCACCQALTQRRRCVFHVKPQNYRYTTAGNVNGSLQLCEHTHCCVGHFLIRDGKPEIDLLACDLLEKSCPDATCKPQTRFNNQVIKCVCNTDLCNSNITWTPETEEAALADSSSVDKLKTVILVGIVVLLCLLVAVVTWKCFYHEKKGNPQARPHASHAAPLCSCQTTKTSEIDAAEVELQQVVACGHFATVWRGRYQGSVVAVKVIPAGLKHIFATEKEVLELPLMRHAGIVHFLGAGRKPDDGSWLVLLELAEYGSLHSFLCKHTSSWMLSLKLGQSLSQGLCYLHSDLLAHDVHKPPVAHRDLSSFNVLVRADGSCALSDFGCSTILRSWSGHHRGAGQTAHSGGGEAQVGTLSFMSPEVLEGSVNLRSSDWCLQGDVYALGLLLWEIWMCCSDLFPGGIVPQHLLPYELELGSNMTRENLTWYVSHLKKRPSIPKAWALLSQGSVLQDTLEGCWECDADGRLTAACVAERLTSLQLSFSS